MCPVINSLHPNCRRVLFYCYWAVISKAAANHGLYGVDFFVMDGAGGGHCGPNQKILQLQRALSGGFGFSLMGGRGTGFPPVICDILSDSPASECDGVSVKSRNID